METMEKNRPKNYAIYRALIVGIPLALAIMVFIFGAIEMRRAEGNPVEFIPSDAVFVIRFTDAADWWRKARETEIWRRLEDGDFDILVRADSLKRRADLSNYRAYIQDGENLKKEKIADIYSPDLLFDPIKGDLYIAGVYDAGGQFHILALARMGYKSYLASKFDVQALEKANIEFA